MQALCWKNIDAQRLCEKNVRIGQENQKSVCMIGAMCKLWITNTSLRVRKQRVSNVKESWKYIIRQALCWQNMCAQTLCEQRVIIGQENQKSLCIIEAMCKLWITNMSLRVRTQRVSNVEEIWKHIIKQALCWQNMCAQTLCQHIDRTAKEIYKSYSRI